jgi:hypothetical protein
MNFSIAFKVKRNRPVYKTGTNSVSMTKKAKKSDQNHHLSILKGNYFVFA